MVRSHLYELLGMVYIGYHITGPHFMVNIHMCPHPLPMDIECELKKIEFYEVTPVEIFLVLGSFICSYFGRTR